MMVPMDSPALALHFYAQLASLRGPCEVLALGFPGEMVEKSDFFDLEAP